MDIKLSPRDQMMALGIGMIVIVALVVLFVLKPQFERISALKAEQVTEKAKLAEAVLQLQRLDAVRAEAAQIEAERILLARRMPDDAELPSMVVELQKTADAAGLDFASVRIESIANLSSYSEIPFSISMSGTFYSVIDYLYRLEKMTREVVVESVSLKPSEYPQLQVDIRAKTFKLNQAGAQLPPPGGIPAAAPAAGAAAPAGQ